MIPLNPNMETLYVFTLLFSTFAGVWLSAYAWRRQPVRGARASSLSFAAVSVWLWSMAAQIVFPDSPTWPVWVIGYSSLMLAPLGWIALALSLSGHYEWLSPRRFAFFAVIPVAAVGLLWTNQWHGTMYGEAKPIVVGLVRVVDYVPRLGLQVSAAYSYLLVILGVLLLVVTASRAPSALRGQIIAVLAGALIPSLAGAVDTLGMEVIPGVDLAPLTVGLSGLIIAWGLFHYRLFDVVPIARHRVFAAMPDGVAVLDSVGRVVDLNATAETILGCSLRQSLGRRGVDVVKPYPELAYLCVTNVEMQIECAIDLNGQRHFFEAKLSRVADDSGMAVGSMLTLHEVTERIEIERALRQSEQRFRDLADSLPETVFETDLTGRLTFGNKSGMAQFGISEQEFEKGINVMECIVADDHGRARENFGRALQDLRRESNVYTARRRDGTTFPITIYAVRVLRDGQPVGLRGFLVDISDRVRAEAQLLEQQRALAILGERDRLARDLHDNLAQVLGFVNTQAQAIRTSLSTGNTAPVDGQLGRLISIVQEAHGDVREYILSVKTLSAPGWALFPALEQTLRRYQNNYGVQTELVIPEGIAALKLEPTAEVQIERIVQEALTNIRKHASASLARVLFGNRDGNLEVAVEDDGTGFDVDRALDAERQTFGLRIMRERAQEIKGTLEVRSAPGQGTRIAVVVPLAKGDEQ